MDDTQLLAATGNVWCVVRVDKNRMRGGPTKFVRAEYEYQAEAIGALLLGCRETSVLAWPWNPAADSAMRNYLEVAE